MKKSTSLLVAIIVIVTTLNATAQSGFSALIKAGPADATKLVDAYGEPLFKGFGIGLNSGWNNTAKTKKLLHFDLRISANAAMVPTSDKTFDVTKIGLSNNIRPADPSQTMAPTFAGDKNTTGPLLNIYDDNGTKVGSFNTPKGVLSIIPAPTVQLTVGLFKNTDLTARYIPSIKTGGNSDAGSVSMYGFGLKHDIIQDFVGKKAGKIIPFDLAIAFGFSHLSLNIPLTVNPDNGAQPKDAQQSTDFSNQHISGTFNSFMAQAIISKKLLFFTPFLAVGYNTTQTTIGALGNYPVTTGGTIVTSTYTTYPNPINIKETSVNGLRTDVGFQLNLAIFR
ncbi:MAG: DUF6588 family protein, partial [Mucilaginibacter sp.]